jgi:hypothetical protein
MRCLIDRTDRRRESHERDKEIARNEDKDFIGILRT